MKQTNPPHLHGAGKSRWRKGRRWQLCSSPSRKAAPCWPRRGPAPRWRVVRLASSQAQPLQEEHPRLPRQSRRKKRGSSAREGFSWESCSPLFVAAKHKPDLVPVFNNHIRSCSTTQFSFTPLTGPSWKKISFSFPISFSSNVVPL